MPASLILALLIRTFLFQPFNIPSGASMPTLLVGDYILVSKFAYGYSRFSLPFGARLFSGRLFAAFPKRGDMLVFKLPSDGTTDYIKRVVGLPGDSVQLTRGRLYINGRVTPRRQVGTSMVRRADGRKGPAPVYDETLPGSDPLHPEIGAVTHPILEIDGDDGFLDNTKVYKVPPGDYFVLGDNRDNSLDSRIGPADGGIGYVPFENLVGRAEFIFFSMKTTDEPFGSDTEPVWETWRWSETVRWNRLFTRIR